MGPRRPPRWLQDGTLADLKPLRRHLGATWRQHGRQDGNMEATSSNMETTSSKMAPSSGENASAVIRHHGMREAILAPLNAFCRRSFRKSDTACGTKCRRRTQPAEREPGRQPNGDILHANERPCGYELSAAEGVPRNMLFSLCFLQLFCYNSLSE